MQHQTRIIIENVLPQLHCGAFAIKRIVDQKVFVTADVFRMGMTWSNVACSSSMKAKMTGVKCA